MHINWFTVIAQALNFILLVWLMKRFLYTPILDAIDQREQKIKAELSEANAQKADAQKEKDAFQQKNKDFDQQKKALMDMAVDQVQTERRTLLEAARQEAEGLQVKQQKLMKEAQHNLQNDIAGKARQAVFSITKKALANLASVGLEDQTVAVFTERLHHLSPVEKQPFIDAFQSDKKPIEVQSAFELTVKQQAAIKTAVTNLLGLEPDFVFKTNADLISGIDLQSNGFKLAWSVSDYLTALEKSSSSPNGTTKSKEKGETIQHAVN
ncbi:MAG: H(+)-transporting synthase, subunit [Spirosoma sp.]|nr:H(+)-transporting synthase, subunit [Spirosoma sp.]